MDATGNMSWSRFGALALLIGTLGWGGPALADQAESSVTCDEGVIAEPILMSYHDHTVGCAFDDPLDSDVFTFVGAAGDQVRLPFQADRNGLTPYLEILDPSGSAVATGSCGTSGHCTFDLALTLTVDGTYFIIVSESGNDLYGGYHFNLERVPPAFPAPTLPYQATETSSANPSTDMDYYVFKGVAGTQVNIGLRSLTNGLGPTLEISDPTGTVMDTLACGSSGHCTTEKTYTLTRDGLYRMTFYEAGHDLTGSYEINVSCFFGPCFGTEFTTVNRYLDVATVDDLSGDGRPEEAALYLRRRAGTDGKVEETTLAAVRNTLQDYASSVWFFGDGWTPRAMVQVPDLDGNGVPELAVLAVNSFNGVNKVKIRDIQTRAIVSEVAFFAGSWSSRGLTVVPDQNGNGIVELSVLAVNDSTGAVKSRIKDAVTGEDIGQVVYPR